MLAEGRGRPPGGPRGAGELDGNAGAAIAAGQLDHHVAVPGMGMGQNLRHVEHRPRRQTDFQQPVAERFAVLLCEQAFEFGGERGAIGDPPGVVGKALILSQGVWTRKG